MKALLGDNVAQEPTTIEAKYNITSEAWQELFLSIAINSLDNLISSVWKYKKFECN